MSVTIEDLIELARQGLTARQIGDAVGMSRTTIASRFARAGLKISHYAKRQTHGRGPRVRRKGLHWGEKSLTEPGIISDLARDDAYVAACWRLGGFPRAFKAQGLAA